jgi:RNA polymerase sigma factor (sigma-70 family)
MSPFADDRADWALAVAGDGEAFGRVFDRHRARVLRHSVRLVAAIGDAEDVVAIVFLEAWRKRHLLHFVDGSALPWLLATATNVSHNLARSSRRYERLLAKLPEAEPVGDHADGFGDDDALSALRTLSLRDQQVVTLCVIEGLSEKETASTLKIPLGTVKSRLSRAKARLASQVHRADHFALPLSKEATHEY